jgi:hypothetical protein
MIIRDFYFCQYLLFEGGLLPKNRPFGGGASGAVQFPANDGGQETPGEKSPQDFFFSIEDIPPQSGGVLHLNFLHIF